MRVVLACPTVTKPYQCLIDSITNAVPLMDAKGWEHSLVWNIGGPYISHNRATMLRKAQDAGFDVIVFLDHDISFDPDDLIALIESEGDLVGGTYRFKDDDEKYMGALLPGIDGTPQVRDDGALKAHCLPAGFLKLTRTGLSKFMFCYPELQYIDKGTLTVDLFNHGAHNGVWYGEDYALCRNWIEKCGELWCIPNLNIDHHGQDGTVYEGNFHEWLLKQPGGSEHVG